MCVCPFARMSVRLYLNWLLGAWRHVIKGLQFKVSFKEQNNTFNQRVGGS